jgi:hypothetical protein
MGKSVRRIGRRARKRFVRILRPSWSTLPPPYLPLKTANMRTARRMGLSVRVSTNYSGVATRGDEVDVTGDVDLPYHAWCPSDTQRLDIIDIKLP